MIIKRNRFAQERKPVWFRRYCGLRSKDFQLAGGDTGLIQVEIHVRGAAVSLHTDEKWSHTWRPLREINRRLEGLGWEHQHWGSRWGRKANERNWSQWCHKPGSQKLKGERMWSVPPEATMEPRHMWEEVNEKAGEHQGFCLVAANQDRAENTKAPVTTMLFSPSPPNTGVGSPMVPSFQQGLSVPWKEIMNCQ